MICLQGDLWQIGPSFYREARITPKVSAAARAFLKPSLSNFYSIML
jgi:hypothetical protein